MHLPLSILYDAMTVLCIYVWMPSSSSNFWLEITLTINLVYITLELVDWKKYVLTICEKKELQN